MLNNYVLIAIRNLRKSKISTGVNLLCLAIGMGCCMLILLFIKDELSYNKYNTQYNSIYRINWTSNRDGKLVHNAITPIPLGKAILNEVPQVEKLTRLYQRSGGMDMSNSKTGGGAIKKFQEQNVYFSDSSVFSIFSFTFLSGNPSGALTNINSVVITDEMASKYFGEQNPIGKFLYYDAKSLLQVTGVIKKQPANSDLQFDFLVSFETLFSVENAEIAEFLRNDWTYNPVFTYCTLKEGANPKTVNLLLNNVLKKNGTLRNRQLNTVYLEAFSRQHLYASEVRGNPSTGSYSYIFLFGAVALLILLIANLNYINLATARASTRVREIGLRKVLGAHKAQLAFQFLSETLIVCALAFIVAILFTQLSLPLLNELTGKKLNWQSWFSLETLLLFILLFLTSGITSGIYPAFFITRFNTILSLKGKTGETGKKKLLRKSLLVTQFCISIGLIASAIIIYQQLQYMRNKPLGFNKDYVINVPIFGSGSSSLGYGVDGPMRQRMNTFSNELLRYSRIKDVTAASALPGQWYIPGLVIPEGASETDNIFIPWLCVDYNFISAFKIPILAGRDFSKKTGTDHLEAFIINETAVKTFGWKTPQHAIGKTIIRGKQDDGKKGRVIGVIKDHHFNSLDQALQPLIMDVMVARFSAFAISIQPDHIPETIEYIRERWNMIFPERVFEYTFLDQDINAQYQANENLARITGYFALLAILLSCLGLLSLSSFLITQRTREIGIRKVLGSGIPGIIALLSKEFLILVLLAFMLTTPFVFYFMNKWLQNYYYRIDLQWWVFSLAGVLVFILTAITVSIQSTKAALMNPITSLRSE